MRGEEEGIYPASSVTRGGMSDAVHGEFNFLSGVNYTIVSVNFRGKGNCEGMSSGTYIQHRTRGGVPGDHDRNRRVVREGSDLARSRPF